jgi:hypothetical protein
MLTIVELPEYRRRLKTLLATDENTSLISFLARHPDAGALMQGTGGIRKLRWAAKGKGKSGGIRVIYYFYNRSIPLFLLSAYGKNEKANLSKTETNELSSLVEILKQHYGETP